MSAAAAKLCCWDTSALSPQQCFWDDPSFLRLCPSELQAALLLYAVIFFC